MFFGAINPQTRLSWCSDSRKHSESLTKHLLEKTGLKVLIGFIEKNEFMRVPTNPLGTHIVYKLDDIPTLILFKGKNILRRVENKLMEDEVIEMIVKGILKIKFKAKFSL